MDSSGIARQFFFGATVVARADSGLGTLRGQASAKLNSNVIIWNSSVIIWNSNVII
jgi:hypothetical protein